MNLPGAVVDLPTLTEKDIGTLRLSQLINCDFLKIQMISRTSVSSMVLTLLLLPLYVRPVILSSFAKYLAARELTSR